MNLKIFLGKQEPNVYRLSTGQPMQQFTVTSTPSQVRPYVVGAVLRNIHFTPASFKSFLDLQDKLHQNICRRRTLVAIGTHDLDTIQGPFVYDAKVPSEINFRPLNQPEEMNSQEILALYRTDNKMKQYVPIIENSPVFPVIYDAQGVVLSFPPIINSEHSKISVDTRNVLIESTSTDYHKSIVVLNQLVCMFSIYCEPQTCVVEPVQVTYPNGEIKTTPDFETISMEVNCEYVRKLVNVPSLSSQEMAVLLQKMSLLATERSSEVLSVAIPLTRPDILHPCDIAEDVAIAYGFNRVEFEVPSTQTIGSQYWVNKYSDFTRQECAQAGFTEILTNALTSREDNFDILQHTEGFDGQQNAVHIANPKNSDFQVARTTLMSGLLKTLAANKAHALPLKLFEVSDIVIRDPNVLLQAKNVRKMCAVYCDTISGFEIIHGLVDLILQKSVGNNLTFSTEAVKSNANTEQRYYWLQPSADPVLFPGRQAYVIFEGQNVGIFGIVHPTVLANFGLKNVASICEIDVESIWKAMGYQNTT